MGNFLLYLHSCLSHCQINLSGYLWDQLHQEVLVEVLHMDHDTVEMAYVVSKGLFAVQCMWDLPVDVGVMVWVDVEVTH